VLSPAKNRERVKVCRQTHARWGASRHGHRSAGLRHGAFAHEFVSTTLASEERRRFSVVEGEWVEVNPASGQLNAKTIELLDDWGAFLDVNLYGGALVHFLGGANSGCKPVERFSGSRPIGTQNLNMLDQDSAFAFTTKQGSASVMREHLERFLHHTRLKFIQWVNLNRHRVEFATLRPR